MPEKLIQGPFGGHELSARGTAVARASNKKKRLDAAAWSGTWPAPGSTLDLDFANNRGWVKGVGQGCVMDAITFTRASSATWVDSAGVLRTGAGTFPGTANAEGKNLRAFPQDFDNAEWSKSNAAIIPNTAIAPDGTLSADLLQENSTNNPHHILSGVSTVTGGTNFTLSVYAKPSGREWLAIQSNGGSLSAYFNLAGSGSIGTVGSGVTANITAIENGWYRCSISAVAATTGNIFLLSKYK
jgi:hypothetical protein